SPVDRRKIGAHAGNAKAELQLYRTAMHVPRTRSAPSPNQTPACRGLVTLRLAGSGQARSRLGEGWGGGERARSIFLCAPSLSLARKRGRGTHRVCGAGVASLACGTWQELGPDLGAVLAERGHGAVAPRRGVAARGRRGVAHRPRRRADLDAAQLRMHREIGGGGCAGGGAVRGGELF